MKNPMTPTEMKQAIDDNYAEYDMQYRRFNQSGSVSKWEDRASAYIGEPLNFTVCEYRRKAEPFIEENEMSDLEKRIEQLEERMAYVEELVLPIQPPIEPPVVQPELPMTPIDIDMSRAYHIDFHLGEDERKIFRFKFSNTEKQSYAHFTAVQLGSGGCLELAIPAYGYMQDDCAKETSEGIATDGQHTDWVVRKDEYIYLHVTNYRSPVTVRLKSNGENLY